MCGYGALRAPSRNFRPVTIHAMGFLNLSQRSGIFRSMLSGALFHRRVNRAGPEVRTWRPLGEIQFQ